MDFLSNPIFIGIAISAVPLIIASVIAGVFQARSAKVTSALTLLGVLQTDSVNMRAALKTCEERSDKLEDRAIVLSDLIELLRKERDVAREAAQVQRTSDEKDILLTKARIELLEKAAVAAEAARLITATATAAQAVLDTAKAAALLGQTPPAIHTDSTVKAAPHVEGETDAVYAPVVVLAPLPDKPDGV